MGEAGGVGVCWGMLNVTCRCLGTIWRELGMLMGSMVLGEE